MPRPPSATSDAVRRSMVGNRRVDTAPERRLRSELHRRGFRFRKDLRIEVPDLRVRPDVVFTRPRVAVFIDGCFWHRCPEHATNPRANADYWLPKLNENVVRDRRIDAALVAAGWKVVRVWEHEPPSEAAERIARLLESPGTGTAS
jgi:DNA mismatch endonuclease (patch repair protein)